MISLLYFVVVSLCLVGLHTNIHVCACEIANDCSNVTSPEQIRIAWRSKDTMTISWRTSWLPNSTNGTYVPRVMYGLSCTLEDGIIANGTSTSYTKVGIISWFHDVVINVSYSTRYCYVILESLCITNSTPHSFTSQPEFGDPIPTNITIVGDMGSPADPDPAAVQQTMDALASMVNKTNVFLHVGDISYADDHFFSNISIKYETAWNQFQSYMEAVTANNIYMTAPGNHEVTCTQAGDWLCEYYPSNEITKQYRNFSAYLHRFSMPGGESNDTYKNLWYSFDYGLAHIVVINTETDFDNAPSGPNTKLNGGNFQPDQTQVNWLKKDLETADKRRCQVPWIIVAGHRPWYGSVPNYGHTPQDLRSDNCEPCRKAFAEIIFNNSVNFYFGGHVHWYERLFPVDRNGDSLGNNYTEPQGPIYITTGAGGAPEGAQKVNITANASAVINSTYGFSQLQLINASVAKLYFFQSSDMQKLDDITITRTHNCTPLCSH